MVANAANQLTLLNILRAKEREPLHFTSISKLNGSAGLNAKASGGVDAKGATLTTARDAAAAITGTSSASGAEVVKPALEAQVTSSSAFDVAVLDTQEFYQGILGSVPPSVIAHYLHQGWPRELITSLFVEAVELVPQTAVTGVDGRSYGAGQAIKRFHNDPRRRSEGQTMIKQFFDCYQLVNYTRETPDRPLLQVKDLKEISLEGLAVLDGKSFDLKPPVGSSATQTGDYWINRKGSSSDALMLMLVGDEQACKAPYAPEKLIALPQAIAGDLESYDVEVNTSASKLRSDEELARLGSLRYRFKTRPAEPAAPGRAAKPATTPEPIVIDIHLTIRSIDGVINFLGECLRSDGTCEPMMGGGKSDALMVVTTDKPDKVFVSANFRDETYYVPAGQGDGGRSSQIFALIQQLVNLQKSVKERPATQTVRVVQ